MENLNSKTRDYIANYLYYFIIGIVSLIALGFLPFLGSSVGLSWNVPTTTSGWVVWGVTKAIVAIINVLIFHSFMCQARINVKNDPHYIKAQDILRAAKIKEVQPRSPAKWKAKQYGTKGVMIALTTGLATISLSQALLTFDYVSLLTYIFTILMGLVMGILQMKQAEIYWTEEYYKYALTVLSDKKEDNSEKKEDNNNVES